MEVNDDDINSPDIIDSAPASPSISSDTSVSDTDSEPLENDENGEGCFDPPVTSHLSDDQPIDSSANNNNDNCAFHVGDSNVFKDNDDSENEGSDLNDKGGIDFPVACNAGDGSYESRENLEDETSGTIGHTNWINESGSDVDSDGSNLGEPESGCENSLRGIEDEPVSHCYDSNSNVSDSPDDHQDVDLDADHDIYDGNFNEAECLQNRLNQQAVSSLDFFENSGESSDEGLQQVADSGRSPHLGDESLNDNGRPFGESVLTSEYCDDINEAQHLPEGNDGRIGVPVSCSPVDNLNELGASVGDHSPGGSGSHVQSSSEITGNQVKKSCERSNSPIIDSQCDSQIPSSDTHIPHHRASESSAGIDISQSDSISKCHIQTSDSRKSYSQDEENIVSSSNYQVEHNAESSPPTFHSTNIDQTEPISDNEMSDGMDDEDESHNLSSKQRFKSDDLSDVSDDDNLDIAMEENDRNYNKYDLSRDDSDQEKKISKTSAQKTDSVKVKAHSSFSEDHVELDYDEEVHEDVPAQGQDGQLEEGEEEMEEGEERDSDRDEGELDDDDDCEEGEIREPGTRKPNCPPICRFYARGHCTWGAICRFIHPGINDKGNYRLLDDGPAFNGRGRGDAPIPFDRERWEPKAEVDLPPPPDMPPPSETAWERGLRHAKEMMKKSAQRKEQEPDFEEKRFNLSVEEDAKEMNKENERMTKYYRDPYYDGELYDDEYYDKTAAPGWNGGQYENFEVRNVYNRSPDFPVPERELGKEKLRERHSSPVPVKVEKRDEKWREKVNEVPVPKIKADEWHDPWQRSKSPKQKKRSSRSRSRGRKKTRRSASYSSYSSSSSSSYSRSDSGSSLSRSPTPPPPTRRPAPVPVNRRPQPPPRLSEPPKSAVTVKQRQRSPIKRKVTGPPISLPPERGRLPPERGRPPPRGMPKTRGRRPGKLPPPSRRRSRSSSNSSGSRSRSSSSFSRSRSHSASSFSSGSSSFSSSSSGSADSDNLYRDLPSPASSASSRSPSPKKRGGKTKHRHLRDKNLHKERPETGRRKSGPDAKLKNRSAPINRPPPLTPTKSTKDPLKLSGQKQNIKLTLLNKQPSDKPVSNVSKKRPAEPPTLAPPAKKSAPVVAEPVKEKMVKPSKPQRLPSPKQKLPSPVKMPSKPLSTAQVSVKQVQAAKPTPAVTNQQPATNTTAKVKKSMSSRREELLKQLKAVEDAIAKKRSKPN